MGTLAEHMLIMEQLGQSSSRFGRGTAHTHTHTNTHTQSREMNAGPREGSHVASWSLRRCASIQPVKSGQNGFRLAGLASASRCASQSLVEPLQPSALQGEALTVQARSWSLGAPRAHLALVGPSSKRDEGVRGAGTAGCGGLSQGLKADMPRPLPAQPRSRALTQTHAGPRSNATASCAAAIGSRASEAAPSLSESCAHRRLLPRYPSHASIGGCSLAIRVMRASEIGRAHV